MANPIDNIMTSLRKQGSIDPASSQQRKAQMKPMQRQMGASPRAQPGQRPPDELSETLSDIGADKAREAGKEGDIQVGPQDMTPVIVDQLNETIISLKVQLHREQDKERRRSMERQADQLRKQVTALGGEPIWADESVEEGMEKLQGYGWAGLDRLTEAIREAGGKRAEFQITDHHSPGVQLVDDKRRPDVTSPMRDAGVPGPTTTDHTYDPHSPALEGRDAGVSPAPTTTGILRTGASGGQVRDAQQHLRNLGYNVGPVDGKYGPQTSSAVRAFQREAGITVDGILGPETMEAMSQAAPREKPAPGTAAPGTTPTPTVEGEAPPVEQEDDILRQLGILDDPEPERPVEDSPVRSFLESAGGEVDWDPDTGEVIVRGPDTGEEGFRFEPDRVEDGTSYMSDEDLRHIANITGLDVPDPERVDDGLPAEWDETPAFELPEPMVDEEYINDMFSQYGLEPRSEEELKAQADAMVERMALPKRQAIEREIERFERDWPNEFDKIKEDVRGEAAHIKSEYREEFSARGMFYSSILSENLQDMDEQTMETIREISTEAANHVLDLRSDLRDVEEWAAVEREVVRRELETEDRQMGMQLAQMHMNVAIHADQMNLDRAYKSTVLDIEQRKQQMDEMMFDVEMAKHEGEMNAAAILSQQPVIKEGLRSMGINTTDFSQLDRSTQASMVERVMEYQMYDLERRHMEANTASIYANTALTEAQTDLTRAQIGWGGADRALGAGTGAVGEEDPFGIGPEEAMATVDNLLGQIDGKIAQSVQAAQEGTSPMWRQISEDLRTARTFADQIPDGSIKQEFHNRIDDAERKTRTAERRTRGN